MTPTQLELLHTTSKLGHKETLRERLKRSMNRQKAGLDLTTEETEELYQQKEGEEEEEEEEEMLTTRASKQTTTGVSTGKAGEATRTTASPVLTKTTVSSATVEDAKKKKTKAKHKTKIATSIVPMMHEAADHAAPASKGLQSEVPTAPPASVAVAEPEAEPSAAASDTSQNAAMAKLEALRKKNELRRRERELLKANGGAPSQPAGPVEEAEVAPHDVYVPTPIVLKTTEQMRQQSASEKPTLAYKTTLVKLKRNPDIQLARMQLPVCSSEQEIMEAITENDVVILCGETGSGKTTQVPQFLYEAGYGHPQDPLHSGRIGVTQPRRVAAVATAKRVAEELNVAFGGGPKGHVGYQIRYDAAHVGDKTRIKFMTDGILLKEIQQDFLLRQYSILLLDEAHERNVNTDILIGLLSRIAPLRAQMAKEEQDAYSMLNEDEKKTTPRPMLPLKLVIMSATLRVEDFTENKRLFPTPPPVLRVQARQYPVTVHFNKRTELDDYVSEAYKKVVKIHKKLPEGGILVFLTGQREIAQLCRQLKRTYSEGKKKERRAPQHRDGDAGALVQENRTQASGDDRILREHDDIEEEADLEDAQVYGADEDTADYALGSDQEEEKDSDQDDEDEDDEELVLPFMHVLPLYSLLPHDEQMKVFEAPPPKHRLVVVATNVAETSLTIPNIKYVVDAGRTKERVFDLANGISTFQVQWISKASADQRAGRAGRTGPGHCYRLYSSAVYDTDFAKFSPPEILCQPIEDLALQMKAMGIHNILQFPFPTPPDQQAIRLALQTLSHLGAITEGDDEAITPLGRVLVKFPVAARFAKMLLLAKQLGVLEYTIAIVAGLSGHTPFVSALDRRDKERDEEAEGEDKDDKKKAGPEDDMEKEWREADKLRRHAQWVNTDSDVLSLLRAAGAYAYAGASAQFCIDNHLHEKTMQNMLQLRQQLTRIVNKMYAEEEEDFEPISLSPRMPPPDAETQILLRQIVAAGFLDQVANRVPPGTITEGSKIERNCAFVTASGAVHEPVYIHPHSHVFTPDASKLPAFVVYQTIQRTSRAYLKTVTAVEPQWLTSIGRNTPLCTYSPPLAEPAPSYNTTSDEIECFVKAYYGVHKWSLPVAKVPYPDESSKTATTSESGDAASKGGFDTGSRAKWFAKFLLDGVVIDGLQAFAHSLKEPSYMVIRKKFDKKIQLLVTKLQKKRVSSRAALVATWRSEPAFLRAELAIWYANDKQKAFLKAWPRIVEDALIDNA
jgi:ATP-dependent RNA helicase DHX37/DHR1